MRYLALLLLLTASCQSRSEEPRPGAAERVKISREGEDWPRLYGPNGDGTSTETGIIKNWPDAGLKKLWSAELGLGYAPPVVAQGRLFHFDRFADNARLTCRNAETGELIWKYEYPTEYIDQYGYDPGPRTTPVVDGGIVYILGVDGVLVAIQVIDGEEIWKVETKKQYHFHQNFFGVSSAPLVVGDLLIVAVGGSPKGPKPFDLRDAESNGTAIVAFDKKTGKEVYKVGNNFASYTSPMLVKLNNQDVVLYFARNGLIAIEPKKGKRLFEFPYRAKSLESVNAANPAVFDNRILLTECYEKGSVLLEVQKDWNLKTIWSDEDNEALDKILMGHWCTPIFDGQYIYGCSGRHTPQADLRCIDAKTGEVLWKEPRTTRCTMTKIDGHILCLAEDGTLTLFKLNPKEFEKISQWQEVPDLEYPAWAPPVVSRGLLYLRGKDKLACYELIPKK